MNSMGEAQPVKVRKMPLLAQKLGQLVFCSYIPTGTHGSTRNFWANLTPLSVKGPELGAVPYEPKYEFTSDLGTCGHVAYHPTFRYKSTSYKVPHRVASYHIGAIALTV